MAEYWLSIGKAVAQRNRRGEIVCVQFRESNGANPLRGSARMGTYYSFEERIGDFYVWAHNFRRIFRNGPLPGMSRA